MLIPKKDIYSTPSKTQETSCKKRLVVVVGEIQKIRKLLRMQSSEQDTAIATKSLQQAGAVTQTVNPSLPRQRKAGFCEFQASLVYTVRLKEARTTQ